MQGFANGGAADTDFVRYKFFGNARAGNKEVAADPVDPERLGLLRNCVILAPTPRRCSMRFQK